jgi:hypothetical protein
VKEAFEAACGSERDGRRALTGRFVKGHYEGSSRLCNRARDDTIMGAGETFRGPASGAGGAGATMSGGSSPQRWDPAPGGGVKV